MPRSGPQTIHRKVHPLTALLVAATLVSATGLTVRVQAADLDQTQSPQRYIIHYKVDQYAALSKHLHRAGSQELRHLQRQRALVAMLTEADVRTLQLQPSINSLELDHRRYRLGQLKPYGTALIQAEQFSPFGTPRKLCIIDSGYDAEHPDLPGSDRVSGQALAGTGRWDEPGDSHGTHVAGTIAALHNKIGVVGIHPGVGLSLHVVKVFADHGLWTFASELVAALEACQDAGAHVVSMSLGGAQKTTLERGAFAHAYASGALLVAAAGNDGSTACSYPACYEPVISVAAVDRSKRHAVFSQRNTRVELSAPGVGVWSTVVGGDIQPYSGTSMAVPHVSGAAALLWSLHAECDNAAIRQALTNSAEDLGDPGRDTNYGFGLVQLGAADVLLSSNGCALASN